MDNKVERISKSTGNLIIMFAVFCDAVQFFISFIPFLGQVTIDLSDIFIGFLIWLIFKLNGVNYKATLALVSGILLFLKLIPVVQDAPLWSVDVVAVIAMVKLEDKTGLSAEKIEQGITQPKKISPPVPKNNTPAQNTGTQQQKIIAQREQLTKRNQNNQKSNIIEPKNFNANEKAPTTENLQITA